MNLKNLLLFLITIFTNLSLYSQYQQTQKLVAQDRESRAEFGTTIALNDEFLVVGATRETIAEGAAYVYKKEHESWNFHQKITAYDASEMDEFTSSMKLDQDLLVIAAGRKNLDEDNLQVGAIYIYEFNETTQSFEFTQKLLASNSENGSLLGSHITSLDVQNNRILVGAQGHNNWDGAAYLFEKIDNQWVQTQIFDNPESLALGNFGVAVSISEDQIAIGANGTHNGKGSVYLYKQSNGNWQFTQTITASDALDYDYFGTSIDIYDHELIVGSYAEGSENPLRAGVYYFTKNSDGLWNQTQRIDSYDSSEHTFFGWICELHQNQLTITSPHIYGQVPGKVLIYEKDSQNLWNLLYEITPNDDHTEDFFGWFATRHQNTLVVGSPRDDRDANGQNEEMDAGSVYVFNIDQLSNHELVSKNSFQIFPNPTSDWIEIQTNEHIISTQLLDLNGNLIINENHKKLSIKHLPKGIYVLKVKLSNGVISNHKIIKQ